MDDNVNNAPAEAAGISNEMILDLNFTPEWARKPAQQNYFDDARPARESRHDRRGGSMDRRQDSRDRDRGRGPRPERRRDGDQREQRPRRFEREPEQFVERPPVSVRFLPQRNYLSEVIRRIKLSKRAHPLLQVAEMFVANPGSCEVRIEVDQAARDAMIAQCKICGMAAMREDTIISHITNDHLETFFTKEEKEGPEPKGSFSCVLECSLSGTLIGPPNHHSTAERIREIRRTRYPNMTEEAYKSRLKTLHEPEKIEQWKQASRKETSYRLKTAAEGDKNLTWSAAEMHLKNSIAPANCLKVKRASLSGKTAKDIKDPGLSLAVRDSWQQESRFPSSLVGALRGAFKHMRLNLFKAGRGAIFVSDIQPSPLDPEKAIPSIKDVLLFLKDHPGGTRQNLVEALRPGSAIDSEEAKEILSPFTWLIERGHIIEFFDGTLAVIHGKPSRSGKPVAEEKKS